MPYDKNVFFTGRDDILEELHEALQRDGAAGLTQALHGLGGIGKTQTAVQYAYLRKDDYSAVFWVRAETAEEIQQGYTQIARRLGLLPEEQNTPQNAVPVVQKWLEDKANGRWLLVYDNADTPELLLPYKLRLAQGRTLITSRHHNFDALNMKKPIALPLWSPEKALEFLLFRTERNENPLSEAEQTAAEQIVKALGFFPLALEQAGAYISAEPCGFADYRDEYTEKHAELLQYSRLVTGYHQDEQTQEYRTVWTTWDLNFKAVQKALPAAAEVLTFSAFLAPEPIPGEILLKGSAHIGPETAKFVAEKGQEWATYNKLLKPLMDYSLIEKESEKHTYTMHRLVQQVLRDRLTPEQQRIQQECVVLALCYAYPGRDFVDWPRCEQFLPHWQKGAEIIQDYTLQFIEAGHLLNQMAGYLNERRQSLGVETLFKLALNIWRHALPEWHPDIALGLSNLGQIYLEQGNYDAAEPLLVEALTIWRQALPQDHFDVAQGMNNLAGLYHAQGRYQEAETLLEEALAIKRRVLPNGDPEIALSLNNLAMLHREHNHDDKAELLYREALSICRQTLPEGHPDIAIYLTNLSGLCVTQGNYSEAENLCKEALKIRRQALPEGHIDIAHSLNILAKLYQRQGFYVEAQQTLNEALTICENALGVNHPTTDLVRGNLVALSRERQPKRILYKLPKRKL